MRSVSCGSLRVGSASLSSAAPQPAVALRAGKPRVAGGGWMGQSFGLLTVLWAHAGVSRGRWGRGSGPSHLLSLSWPPVGQYASPEARRCCQDGLTRLPMARTCEQRAARVRQASCREPFLSCCLFAEVLRKNQTRSQAGFARGEQPGEAGEQ